jgi:TetR/AcrR family transcriptional repressor of nem operon
MKVRKARSEENRSAIIAAAARLFAERGFDGIGVADITREAGLTHGGFYGHFASKQALAAEACGQAFEHSLARLARAKERTGGDFSRFLAGYLTEDHRDRRVPRCPMPAYAGEIPRQEEAVRDSFADGVENYLEAMAAWFAEGGQGDAEECRGKAIAVLSAMVGGMALARATAASDPQFSAEILAVLRRELGERAGA